MQKKLIFLCPLFLALAACTGTPVAVVYDGHALRGDGIVSKDHREFSFTVSDDAIACSARYEMALETKVSAPIQCSNGLKGQIEALRFSERRTVGFMPSRVYEEDYVLGKITFAGGSHGVFILGNEAKGVTADSVIVKDFDSRWDLVIKSRQASKAPLEKEE